MCVCLHTNTRVDIKIISFTYNNFMSYLLTINYYVFLSKFSFFLIVREHEELCYLIACSMRYLFYILQINFFRGKHFTLYVCYNAHFTLIGENSSPVI